MLVNVKFDVETIGRRPNPMQLSWHCKQFLVLRNSQPHSEAYLTDRGEDEFCSNSNAIDTHYSSIQGGIMPCMYT